MKSLNGVLIPESLEDLLDSSRAALLVYDMQVGICSQVEGSARIVGQCSLLVDAARYLGMRIVYTQHLSCPKPWMGATQFRTAMAWQKATDPAAVTPWFARGAPGTAIVSELAPRDEDLVIEKLAMSAFEGTPLEYALRDCGLTGVILCGIALEIGIEPTVRHATDLGFIPVLVADACGHGNREAGARSLTTLRFLGEAVITDVSSFCARARIARNVPQDPLS